MEALVEGVFGRAFRRQVHPVEIAKGLTKQMDEGRMISVSRTYAPNDFTIHLSTDDEESIRAYQRSLREELIQYASAHAGNKGYHLMTPPQIRFTVEDSLKFGEFGVTAKLTGGDGPRERGAPQDTPGSTRIFRTDDIMKGEAGGENKDRDATGSNGGAGGAGGGTGGTAAISPEEARRQGLARETLEVIIGGDRTPLSGGGPWTVGRSSDNDVVVRDPNVSRRHARLLREGDGFVIEDLDSTNGTMLEGAPIDRERIADGDELTFGQTEARFVHRTGSSGQVPRGGR